MLWRSLRGVLNYAWRALDGLRRVIHLFLMLAVLALVLAALAGRPAKLPDAFALVVSPEGVLVEQYSGDAVSRALDSAQGLGRTQTLVSDLVEAIDAAATDSRVKVLHLELDFFGGGSLDKLEQVALALERFRAAGKQVIAAAVGLSHAQYYLAAHADEILVDPNGGIVFQGFGFYRNYYRAALEKASVDWYVFSAGEAKSLGDPYVRDDMSPAERENLQPVADGLWAAWRDTVAAARGLAPDLLDDYVERFLPRLRAAGGDLARVALDAGLADRISTLPEVEQYLADAGGADRHGNYRGIHSDEYLAALRARPAARSAADNDRSAVALLVARGMILPGTQPPGSIGDESLRELLAHAREDDAIRAVVLRIDSGGGSQFAAEAILHELELLRVAGKPLVVSMGGMAASGGYLMALAADEIWAHPTTVTGSIGVVAMVPNFGRLLERLGVGVDGVGTHRFSGDFRLDRPFSPEAREILDVMVDGAYERFLGQVGAARQLARDEVLPMAEGRVWLGEVALEAGLVDHLGTLDDALAAAATLAGIEEDYRVELLEPELGFSERLLVSLLSRSAQFGLGAAWPRSWFDRLPVAMRSLLAEIERLEGFADPRGLYYYCFCDIG